MKWVPLFSLPSCTRLNSYYKYYKHVCFERPSLKEEYKLKCAYCLFEASNEDLTIFNVLFEELYKQYGALYKELKKRYGRSKSISDEGVVTFLKDKESVSRIHLIELSVLDFFLEKLEVGYHETDFFQQLKETYEGVQRKVLDFELEIDELNYQYFKHQLTKPNSMIFKRIKHFCRSYSDYLGQNLVDFFNDKLEAFYQKETLSPIIQWMRELGLIEQHTNYRVTTADVYQLVALLLCTDDENLTEEEVDTMSMPTIPDINPDINICRDDAINILLASIGLEEMALAELMKAESSKLTEVLNCTCNPCEIKELNKSVESLLKVLVTYETILQSKLRDVMELVQCDEMRYSHDEEKKHCHYESNKHDSNEMRHPRDEERKHCHCESNKHDSDEMRHSRDEEKKHFHCESNKHDSDEMRHSRDEEEKHCHCESNKHDSDEMRHPRDEEKKHCHCKSNKHDSDEVEYSFYEDKFHYHYKPNRFYLNRDDNFMYTCEENAKPYYSPYGYDNLSLHSRETHKPFK